MIPERLTAEDLIKYKFLKEIKCKLPQNGVYDKQHFDVLVEAANFEPTSSKNKMWQIMLNTISGTYDNMIMCLPYIDYIPNFQEVFFNEMTLHDIHIRIFGDVSYNRWRGDTEWKLSVGSLWLWEDPKKDIQAIWKRVVAKFKIVDFTECPTEFQYLFLGIRDIKMEKAMQGMGWHLEVENNVLSAIYNSKLTTGVQGISFGQGCIEVLSQSTWACNIDDSTRLAFTLTNPRTGKKGEQWLPTIVVVHDKMIYQKVLS